MVRMLRVTDKDGIVVGQVPARVGMLTTYGSISRFTEKSVWAINRDGVEVLYRAYDGSLPSVPLYRTTKAEREAAGITAPARRTRSQDSN